MIIDRCVFAISCWYQWKFLPKKSTQSSPPGRQNRLICQLELGHGSTPRHKLFDGIMGPWFLLHPSQVSAGCHSPKQKLWWSICSTSFRIETRFTPFVVEIAPKNEFSTHMLSLKMPQVYWTMWHCQIGTRRMDGYICSPQFLQKMFGKVCNPQEPCNKPSKSNKPPNKPI